MIKKTPIKQRQPTSFLFLAGHGLLTPLSALRWGASRLSKSAEKNLTPEQKKIVKTIERNSDLLSRILNSLLFLSRLEDHVYTYNKEDIVIADVLQHESSAWQRYQDIVITINCDKNLTLNEDRAILSHVVENLFGVFLMGNTTEGKIAITCEKTEEGITLRFVGTMDVPFLQYVQTIQLDDNVRSVVGGTQGLFLAITQSLMEHLGGTLEMYEEEEKTYVVEAVFLSNKG